MVRDDSGSLEAREDRMFCVGKFTHGPSTLWRRLVCSFPQKRVSFSIEDGFRSEQMRCTPAQGRIIAFLVLLRNTTKTGIPNGPLIIISLFRNNWRNCPPNPKKKKFRCFYARLPTAWSLIAMLPATIACIRPETGCLTPAGARIGQIRTLQIQFLARQPTSSLHLDFSLIQF